MYIVMLWAYTIAKEGLFLVLVDLSVYVSKVQCKALFRVLHELRGGGTGRPLGSISGFCCVR